MHVVFFPNRDQILICVICEIIHWHNSKSDLKLIRKLYSHQNSFKSNSHHHKMCRCFDRTKLVCVFKTINSIKLSFDRTAIDLNSLKSNHIIKRQFSSTEKYSRLLATRQNLSSNLLKNSVTAYNSSIYKNITRFNSSVANLEMKAILVGAYEVKNGDNKSLELTTLGKKISSETHGKLLEQLDVVGTLKCCKTRFFYHLHKDYPIIAVVGLGPSDATFNEMEDTDEARENVRAGIGSGVNAIRDLGASIDLIEVDACNDAQSAAEGAILANYSFDELKEEVLKAKILPIKLAQTDADLVAKFQRGVVLANYQNKCRNLIEQPANLLTPTRFGEIAKEICEPLGVQVIVHDREWAEKMKMCSFLSVANGSDQPPKFVELHFKNAGDERKPLVFVGKGITFDSGGISLKPGAKMDEMRADMGGAANVLSSIACLATLKAKVNVIGLIPLTENLPSGKATKPGDVVFAMNGKSIQINNTDAEGRLVLADALCYADSFKPELVVDIATLTGACIIALGGTASAVFSTNNDYWNLIRSASHDTGDRVWRMPLYKAYTKKTTDSTLADLVNISKDPGWGAGTAIAAAFLREFVGPNSLNWMHIDMASVMMNQGDYSYMTKGMSGRPLRTVVQFIEKVFNKN